MLSVSVVIPVLNAARTLPACLTALKRLAPPPSEILLVDNGSTDGSLELLRTFAKESTTTEVRVLKEQLRGAAAARNTGIRVARGDVVAFTDSDCSPDPTWVQQFLEPFGDPEVGAVAGRVLSAPTATTLELFSSLYTLQSADRAARYRQWTPGEGGFPTANLTVRRSLLQRLGGFDEGVMIYGEDYDLCARLYALGVAIVYRPDARVFHQHRTTLRGMMRQAFGFGRSHPFLLRRHVTRGLWLDLPGRSLVLARCLLPAWVDLAAADKKLLGLLFAAWLYRPFWALPPLYFVWLMAMTSRRATQAGKPVSLPASALLAGLLIAKSWAMSLGRWWGSVKYGAICL